MLVAAQVAAPAVGSSQTSVPEQFEQLVPLTF